MARNTQTRLDAFLPKTETSPRQPSKTWREEMPEVSDSPLEKHPLRVYVLCGVVGSGKSTLAVQWEALYPEHYVRVNQDSLGDRKKCEILTRESLQEGKSPIIDRQNFDPSQRYHWLSIGYEFGVEVVALVFRTTRRTCSDRLLLRTGHETVKSPEQGLQVLASMLAIFKEPTPEEGFHKIVILPSGLPLRYSLADINALLAKVEDTPTVPAILPPQPVAGPPRGATWSRGNFRGRGGSSRYIQTAERGSPWSRNLPSHGNAPSTHNIGSDPSTERQSRDGRSPPARIVQGGARQASQPYSALSRPQAALSGTSAWSAKQAPSTGFIDISSDDEK